MRAYRILIPLILISLLTAACGLFPSSQPASEPQAVFTQAAQTIEAQLTQQAVGTLIAQLTQIATGATPTPVVPDTGGQPTATPFSLPTDTPAVVLPTQTPAPTATPLPTATQVPSPTPVPCDLAAFVKDVSVPDGSVYDPSADFTKTWRLENVGSCTWNSDYALVFVRGDDMDGKTVVPLRSNVRPGERIDVSVDLRAPNDKGAYRGYWMLRNPNGRLFGIGKDGATPFWVDIAVRTMSNPDYEYDFVANLCNADWYSSAGDLNCPGDPDDEDGSMRVLNTPELENGRKENEPAIWMRPERTNNGWIEGVYPRVKIHDGDRFLADIGCLEDSPGCDVTFRLDYEREDGAVRNLGEWEQVYDGELTRINIDLSDFAGQKLKFILRVEANSKPSKANAFWLVPSIR